MLNAADVIQQALTVSLADSDDLRLRARLMAGDIRIGRSAFLDRHEVESEYEYKKQAMQDGRIMYHAHIGMNDIDATAAALTRVAPRSPEPNTLPKIRGVVAVEV